MTILLKERGKTSLDVSPPLWMEINRRQSFGCSVGDRRFKHVSFCCPLRPQENGWQESDVDLKAQRQDRDNAVLEAGMQKQRITNFSDRGKEMPTSEESVPWGMETLPGALGGLERADGEVPLLQTLESWLDTPTSVLCSRKPSVCSVGGQRGVLQGWEEGGGCAESRIEGNRATEYRDPAASLP